MINYNVKMKYTCLYDRVIRVEKTKFTLDDAIGAFYGSTFEAKGGRLVRIDNTAKDDNMSADKGKKFEY